MGDDDNSGGDDDSEETTPSSSSPDIPDDATSRQTEVVEAKASVDCTIMLSSDDEIIDADDVENYDIIVPFNVNANAGSNIDEEMRAMGLVETQVAGAGTQAVGQETQTVSTDAQAVSPEIVPTVCQETKNLWSETQAMCPVTQAIRSVTQAVSNSDDVGIAQIDPTNADGDYQWSSGAAASGETISIRPVAQAVSNSDVGVAKMHPTYANEDYQWYSSGAAAVSGETISAADYYRIAQAQASYAADVNGAQNVHSVLPSNRPDNGARSLYDYNKGDHISPDDRQSICQGNQAVGGSNDEADPTQMGTMDVRNSQQAYGATTSHAVDGVEVVVVGACEQSLVGVSFDLSNIMFHGPV